jgi:hypothetical protein
MDPAMGVINDPASQVVNNDGVFYSTYRNDDVYGQRGPCPFSMRTGFYNRLLFNGFFKLFCQIVVRVIRLIFFVPFFTLPAMIFLATDRTTRFLTSFLSHIRQKPFSTNWTRAFSTAILCHYIFSIGYVGKNIKAESSAIVNPRRDNGGVSWVLFFIDLRDVAAGYTQPVTLFDHRFEGKALHYLNLASRFWITSSGYRFFEKGKPL